MPALQLCKTRIDDLVFAKTSQGVYCMNCHNDRMAKIRSHVQKKAEREREKRTGGSGSSKSRDRVARDHHAGTGLSLTPSQNFHPDRSTSSRPSSSRDREAPSVRSTAKPISSYVSDAFAAPSAEASSPSNPAQSFSVTVAPPVEPDHPPPPYARSENTSETDRPNPIKQSTLPVPSVSSDPPREERRRSYDDGVRPLNVLFGKDDPRYQPADTPTTAPASSEGLAAPTSRRDKRRSINPGISLSDLNAVHAPQTTHSPHSHSFPANVSADHVSTTLGRESPHTTLSPLREQFSPRSPSSSRPTSDSSLHPSISSRHSSSSSGVPYFDDQELSQPSSPSRSGDHSQDQTIMVTGLSATVTVGTVPPSKVRDKASNPILNPKAGGPQGGDARLSVGTKELEALRSQRSFDDIRRAGSRPSSGASLSAHSQPRSRSVSPAYRADVPHSVESESDTEPEGENLGGRTQSQESLPPAPPPKDAEESLSNRSSAAEGEDVSTPSLDSGSEDFSESSPVEQTSHSTFIAPALPPIRISMSSNDFSELFNSVGGFPSRLSLSQLTKIAEGEKGGTLTPPPTAADFDANITPTIHAPFLPATAEESEAEDDTIRNREEPEARLPLQPVNGRRHSESDDDVPPPTTKPLKLNGVFRRPIASSTSDSSHTPRPQHTPSKSESPASLSRKSSAVAPGRSASTATRTTLADPGFNVPTVLPEDSPNLVTLRLQEAVADARDRGAHQLKMDRTFVEAILSTMETQKGEHLQLKSKFDGVKRTSKQYIEGLTVAQAEYDRELKARRDAESEVTRLRVLLSGQVAKLTALSGDNRKEKLRQQLSKELHDNLSGLELDLSNLRVERDMALAEVEELEATKNATSELPPANLGRSLTKRLDSIKHQYKRDLVPLTKERESLQREIAELKAVRDVFLEETTVLNARNEELAQLSAAYSRRMETVPELAPSNGYHDHTRGSSLDYQRVQQSYPPSIAVSHSLSSSTSSTLHDENMDFRSLRAQKQESDHTPSKVKFMKWGSRAKDVASPPLALAEKKTTPMRHNFQQLSILRFTRCDHCGDKMWGSQLRCTAPSMFGRDLIEQVQADSRGEERQVPVIVEKCIQAVEAIALEYEGIYRKTGGTGQSKAITQLFERGDYMSFDLLDSDRFNDICSVTSVLKTYFRSLPAPLLTYDLHDEFMTAVKIKDHTSRDAALLDLVNRLPDEHYYTLRMLMLHLHHVRECEDVNKMNARNIGVVFGPTLMRSRDPAQEFSDMAGKALSIEWLVENAPQVFNAQGQGLTGYK
ncbi:hypothetical protein DXG01_002507 [Tephrocybe rancida]|nr:hypothetical protein DXG01_002507 [Tephrocybe rancida]